MNAFKTEYTVGKIVGQNKHTETHVYSEGGGGYVGPNGGKIKAPTVKSYNTTRHDIFLLLENGNEMSVSFPFDNLVLRDGHIITLIAAFRDTMNNGYYVKMINHTTSVTYDVANLQTLYAFVNDEVVSRGHKKKPSSGILKGFAIIAFTFWILSALANILFTTINNYQENSSFKAIMQIAVAAIFIVGVIVSVVLGIRAWKITSKNNKAREKLFSELQAELNAKINEAVRQVSN